MRTIAILALLGLTAASQINEGQVAAHQSANLIRLNTHAQSSDSSSSDSDVQLGDDDEEVDHSTEFFKAGEHNMMGDGGYNRVTPPRFAAD